LTLCWHGLFEVQENDCWTDCRTLGSQGKSIPGDIELIQQVESDALVILGIVRMQGSLPIVDHATNHWIGLQ
jgi:DNA topoisomerase VI subunit A